MTGFRVGVADPILAARPAAEALTRANYLGALANRVDSFWVPDHLNQLLPRSLWKQKYCGAAKLIPRVDASMEPWTMLGHLAARNRVGRLHLGVAVTDSGRRNPAVTAQAAATLHLLYPRTGDPRHRPGRARRKRALWGGLVQAGCAVRGGNGHHPRAVGSGGELVNRDSPYFPLRNANDPPISRKMARDLDRCSWSAHAARRGPLRGCLFPELPPPANGIRATSRCRAIGRFRFRSRSDVHHPGNADVRCHGSHPR